MENNKEAIQKLIDIEITKKDAKRQVQADMAYLSGVISGLDDAPETIKTGGE